MMQEFKKGDVVFSEHGQRFVYVAGDGGDHIVRPTMETDEDEPWEGQPITMRKVFASAPREMYDKTIEALDTKIAKLEEQKRALEEEIRKSKFDETERKKRIMVNAALERIDDFLQGKFTHIVFGEYDIRIETFDEALLYKDKDYDRVPTEFRLLTLYGRSKGDLAWKLSRYYDGSGSNRQVFPCFSYEHALTVAMKLIDEQYDKWRTEPQRYGVHGPFNSAVKLGIPIPEDVTTAVKESQIKGALEWRDKKEQEFLEAEKKLENAINQTAVEFEKGKK